MGTINQCKNWTFYVTFSWIILEIHLTKFIFFKNEFNNYESIGVKTFSSEKLFVNDINNSIKYHKINKWCEINNYRITKISKLFSPHRLESIEGIIAETFFDLYQNIFSFGKMVELVNKYGLFIHCMDGFDSRTTFGKNVLKMLLKFCEIEISDLANRT